MNKMNNFILMLCISFSSSKSMLHTTQNFKNHLRLNLICCRQYSKLFRPYCQDKVNQLTKALNENDTQKVDSLLQQGAWLEKKEPFTTSPIHIAAMLDNMQIFDYVSNLRI